MEAFTVQINSNLTLAHVSLAETRLIFKLACDLVASAQTCLGQSMADDTHETRQITRVESGCVSYRVALRVSCS